MQNNKIIYTPSYDTTAYNLSIDIQQNIKLQLKYRNSFNFN